LYIVTITLAFAAGSCNVDNWTKFSLFYAGNSTFSSDSTTGVWSEIYTNKFKVDFTDDLDAHGAKDNQVEETWMERCELHIIEPVSEDFKFFDSIEVYLLAQDLDPLLLAADGSLHMNTNSKKIIVPLVSDKDIEEYLRKGELQYRVRYTQIKGTIIDRHIKVNLKIKVDARRFGL